MDFMTDQAVWEALAREAGLDPRGYEVTRTWRKDTATHRHVVQRLEGSAGAVILKRIFHPVEEKPFVTLVQAQARAAEAMAGQPESVPGLLAFETESRSVLMQAAPGRTVYDLLDHGEDAADALRRAGRWMAAFHRASGTEERTFQPRFMRDHIGHLLRQQKTGEIALARPKDFARHAAAAIALAKAHEGRRTLSAATHGDMHLRNILLDGTRSWGIDFSALHAAPVGFDIARLLLHYTGVFADLDALPGTSVVHPDLLRAFFQGYDLVGPDDPSVQYLLRVRILMDWAAIPARRYARSTGQTRRLRRLGTLADRVFDGEQPSAL